MVANRTQLKRLVSELPDEELDAAYKFLRYLRDSHDPLIRAVLRAPLDDEPETEAERREVAEAKAEIAAGRVISHRALKAKLGL